MKVLGLSGSLRADSHNSRLLRAAAELLPPGAELIVFGGLKAIPPYDEDDEPAGHQAVDALRAAIVDAGAQPLPPRPLQECAGLGVAADHRIAAAEQADRSGRRLDRP